MKKIKHFFKKYLKWKPPLVVVLATMFIPFLFIFFEETALFLLNYIVRYIASVFFGEAEENYY